VGLWNIALEVDATKIMEKHNMATTKEKEYQNVKDGWDIR